MHQMSSVWRASDPAPGELRRKRPMNAAERAQYRKKRKTGACNECKRKKIKCKHEFTLDPESASEPGSVSTMGNTSKPNLASVPRQESESELRSEQLFGAYPEPVLEHTPSSDLPCRSSPGDYLAVSPRYQTSTSPGVSFPGHMDWNGCEFLSFPEDYTRTRGRYPHEEDYDVSAVSFSSTTIPPETYTLPPSNFLSISPQRYEFFDYFPDNIPCSTGLVTHLEKLPPLASKSPPSTSMSNSPAATICSGAKIPGGTAPAEAGKPARAEAGGAAMPTRAKAARYVMPTGPGIFESASIRGQLSTEIEKLVTATRALTT